MVSLRRLLTIVTAVLLAPTLLVACSSTPVDSSSDTALTIGLTYVPNVQFAPFYLAEQNGYFDDAGVTVTLRHHGEAEDLFGALTNGDEDIVVAGGDEMLQARSQGTDVVSIATLYQQYPVSLIVPAESDITSPADLAGHSIGIPGEFGETYFGLLAMLQQAGLGADDVTVTSIGFTQQAALTAGHVDAVMGFSNNDVPQLQAAGIDVRSIDIGDVPLVGISLGTSTELTTEQSQALTAVITAVGRAVAEIAADPELAVTAAEAQLPGTVTDDQRQGMLAVAQATVPLYGDLAGPWGLQDADRWDQMALTMADLGLLGGAVEGGYTNELIDPGAG